MPVTDTVLTCSNMPGLLEIAGAFAFGGIALLCIVRAARMMPSEKSFHPRPGSK